MTDITLGLGVESLGVRKGTKDLNELTNASKKAEDATNGFTGSTKNASAAVTKVGRAVGGARDQYGRFIAANDNAKTAVIRLTDVMQVAIRWASVMGSAMAAAFSVRDMLEFKNALAEVSTLVDTATFNMGALESAAIAQSAAFGGSATQQAKAFYSVISAGAASAAQATNILTEANRLAVGGVTDVATAADGLTSILNAYGDRVESVSAVSDALFVAMRAGKTTIGELSSNLGKVAPLAAQTGVGFDELVGSISALTKGGISTAESITGVRAVLAAIAKPTTEAQKLSRQLGIEFNSAGLAAKGFQQFLSELVDKTGGSTDTLAQLFGGVEALVPAMALAGQAGQDFSNIMDQMANKAGSAQVAFDKMANSPGFQAQRVWAALQAEVLGVSGSLSGPLTAALKAVADNMGTIVTVATIFTAGHLAAAVLPVIANIATLATTIGTAATAARGLSLAMAFFGGPIGLAVGALAAGFLLLRDNTSAAEKAAETANTAFQTNATNLRTAENASQGYSDALRNQIAMQVEAARAALTEADAYTSAAKARKVLFERTTGFSFAPLNYAFQSALAESKALDQALQKLELQLDKVDQSRKNTKEIDGTAPTSRPSGTGRAQDAFANQTKAIKDQIASLQIEAATFGMSESAAAAYRVEKELLAAAAADGTAATAAERAEISNLVNAYSAANDNVARLEQAQQSYTSKLELGRATTKGFLSDMYSGLRQGQSRWEAFGNAANRVVDRLVDNLLNNLVDAIFQVNGASRSGLGGGLGGGGSLLSGLFSIFGFANGGYTGAGPASAVAGVVHGGEYVFSKRATDRIGVGNLDAMHNQARGYASGGYVGGNNNMPPQHIHVTVSVDDEGAIQTYVEKISTEKANQAAASATGAAMNDVRQNFQLLATQAGKNRGR